MYRFIGTTANNYVSLSGVLYRIIGITSAANSTLGLEKGQLKLIIAENIGSVSWFGSGDNQTWDTGGTNANIYTYLQSTSVLGNTDVIPSGWSAKIDSVKWYVGDVGVRSPSAASTIVDRENNKVTSNASKIALIYLSLAKSIE